MKCSPRACLFVLSVVYCAFFFFFSKNFFFENTKGYRDIYHNSPSAVPIPVFAVSCVPPAQKMDFTPTPMCLTGC